MVEHHGSAARGRQCSHEISVETTSYQAGHCSARVPATTVRHQPLRRPFGRHNRIGINRDRLNSFRASEITDADPTECCRNHVSLTHFTPSQTSANCITTLI